MKGAIKFHAMPVTNVLSFFYLVLRLWALGCHQIRQPLLDVMLEIYSFPFLGLWTLAFGLPLNSPDLGLSFPLWALDFGLWAALQIRHTFSWRDLIAFLVSNIRGTFSRMRS